MAIFGIALVAYLDLAKLSATFNKLPGADAAALGMVRVQLALAAAALAGGLLVAGWSAPGAIAAAARTPLRAVALATGAAALMSAAALVVFAGAAERLAAGAGVALARDGLADAAVILVVSMLAVHEALRLLERGAGGRTAASAPASGTGSGSTAPLAGIRFVLFLFMLAEELSRSFLPLYVHDLYTPVPGVSATLAMGLPIALFMLLVAVFTPFAGAWADRFGSRRTLLLGTLPAVAGFAGTALAQSLGELLLWRGACAVGYAVMFIGAQGFVARHTGRGDRARGMAQFVAAVIVAGLCGTAMGGVLADHIGFRATFGVSALLALAAAVGAALLLPPDAATRPAPGGGRWRAWAAVLANPRFVALLLFSSVPTKLMLTGYLFYLVPVALHAMGESPAGIGRIMMGYGLVIVVLGPALSRAADRTGRHALFAGAGGLVAGAGALAVLAAPGVPAVIVGVLALGLGHALNNATQLALVPEVCRAESRLLGTTAVFAVYRLLERGGAVLGPVLAAALADRYGHGAALAGLGGVALAAALAFCAVFAAAAPTRRTPTATTPIATPIAAPITNVPAGAVIASHGEGAR